MGGYNGGLEGFSHVYKEGVIIIDKVLESFIMGFEEWEKNDGFWY